MPIKIVVGDIAKISCDVIVDYYLGTFRQDSEISKRISALGGDSLLVELEKFKSCRVGESVLTNGFGVSASYIIHTIAPMNSEGFAHDLAACYKSAFVLCNTNRFQSIAFPLMIDVSFPISKERAIKVALNRLVANLQRINKNIFVCLVVPDIETLNTTFEIAQNILISSMYTTEEMPVSSRLEPTLLIENSYTQKLDKKVKRDCVDALGIGTSEQKRSIETETNRKKHSVLYIYKGHIRCHRHKHTIIQSTAILYGKTDNQVRLNVEYCTECKKHLLNYIAFEEYRNQYGVLIGHLKMASTDGFDGSNVVAQESPLMLSGYNVSQREGLTSNERHYILARLIYDGIMTKGEILKYLSYFIQKNGKKKGNEIALVKWRDDLKFVQKYDIDVQPKAIISEIRRY